MIEMLKKMIDIDKDGYSEWVTIYGDEASQMISVVNFNKLSGRFENIMNYGVVNCVGNDDIKIVNDKTYIHFSLDPEPIDDLYFGVIEISDDITQEVYFRPISKISIKNWKHLKRYLK